MSKSLGNGVDPVDIIEIHGTDALRYTLAAGATETQDLRLPVEPLKLADGRTINTSERFEHGRNFANKFWNAARSTLMNLEGYEPAALDLKSLPVEDRWILDRLDDAVTGVTSELVHFQFAEASRRLRDFTWNHFCDWYLEFVKGRLRDPEARPARPARARDLARYAVPAAAPDHAVCDRTGLARLEWPGAGARTTRAEPAEESVCIAAWPSPRGWYDPTARRIVEHWARRSRRLRNLKAERNVPKDARIAPILIARGAVADMAETGRAVPPEPPAGRVGDHRLGGRAPRRLRRRRLARGRDHPPAGGSDRSRGRASQATQGAGRARAADRLGTREARQRIVRGAGPRRGRRPNRVPSSPSSSRSAVPSASLLKRS